MKKKNKGGRPKKYIDRTEFEKLCAIQCTKMEICGFLDIDDVTLDRWIKEEYAEEFGPKVSFSEVFARKRGVGKISLRRKQFQMAEKNPAMAIWLGKQYLGQTDRRDYRYQEVKTIEDVVTEAKKIEIEKEEIENNETLEIEYQGIKPKNTIKRIVKEEKKK